MKKWTILWATLLMAGCVTSPYEVNSLANQEYNQRVKPQWTAQNPQIEYGKPNALLDASDWIWPGSLLSKLMLWDRRVDSHDISGKTVQTLQQYLKANQLDSVKVRINQYNPSGEFSRLKRNKGVSPGWRYTAGLISWAGYTLLPGRFFGGDNYNPYTNTINLYSDIDVVSLHEGGHAKDTMSRNYPGTYSFVYAIPLVPLYHEKQATDDALSYARTTASFELEYEGYKKLYPAYGTYLGGASAFLTTGEPLSTLAGALLGHLVGRAKAANFKRHYKNDNVAIEIKR